MDFVINSYIGQLLSQASQLEFENKNIFHQFIFLKVLPALKLVVIFEERFSGADDFVMELHIVEICYLLAFAYVFSGNK